MHWKQVINSGASRALSLFCPLKTVLLTNTSEMEMNLNKIQIDWNNFSNKIVKSGLTNIAQQQKIFENIF